MDKKRFEEVSNMLAELAVFEYQYLYEKGVIRWRDKDEKIVAYSDCKAILSYSDSGESYRWGLFPNTPTVELPEGVSNMKFGVNEEESREVAVKAAIEDNAEFMFAGNWTSLTIYLACNNVVFEEDNTVDESVPWYPVEGDMSKYADIMNAIIEKITV
jgi:hypothetical protein